MTSSLPETSQRGYFGDYCSDQLEDNEALNKIHGRREWEI